MSANVTPDLLLQAYAAGVFPMAESASDEAMFWVDPKRRGIIPLEGFRVSRSLRRRALRGGWTTSLDRDFAAVLDGCAARETTWINGPIRRLYLSLHDAGLAHSQEVWLDGRLAGGVYGVALGAAFFGESMFSAVPDGSKIALAVLVHRLRRAGYALFDTQFVTPHLASLGAVEIPRAEYHRRLRAALAQGAIPLTGPEPGLYEVVQRSTHTS